MSEPQQHPSMPVPPQGYLPPPAFTAPYAPAAPGVFPPTAAPQRSALGVVALVLAIIVVGAATAVGALAAWQIGVGIGPGYITGALADELDLRVLTPVRDWVLLGEVTFWAATVLGSGAVALGIVAITTRRGRGPGIAAVSVAGVGPIVFGTVVGMLIAIGVSVSAAGSAGF